LRTAVSGLESARSAPSTILDQRSAGVLLHVTSLPGPHGSGDLGPDSLRFAGFVRRAGLRWWQMLPIGPIGPGDSPYAATSAFAGSPLLISPERLVNAGLLSEARPLSAYSTERVDFRRTMLHRSRLLRLAFDAWRRAPERGRGELQAFRQRNRHWLEDYVLFTALREAQRRRSWSEWPRELRDRKPRALAEARAALADEIAFEEFVQFEFDHQWRQFREACNKDGVRLIGDIPIFVTHDSSDVWSNRELFLLDRAGRPKVVTGVPPDYFSVTGQLWGHPHYDWRAQAAGGFEWWIERFRRAFEMFDSVRIDHFIGFHRVWQVPGRARTARTGRYVPSAGQALLRAATRALGRLPIIAEDLGAVTPDVWALRDAFGFPGMRVLQFAFGADRYHQPHNYAPQCVVYTGTHDNDTTVGWFGGQSRAVKRRVLEYAGGRAETIHWDMIRLAFGSPANVAIIPMQDYLGLGREARMNIPATPRGNWRWRMASGAANRGLAARIGSMVETFER
jgi:4-alpha-glucanotransferase